MCANTFKILFCSNRIDIQTLSYKFLNFSIGLTTFELNIEVR